MASGSFQIESSNRYVSAVFNWSSTTNISGNYSNFYYEIRASRTNSGYTTSGSGSGNVSLDQSQKPFTLSDSQKITQNSNTLLASGSERIYHESDGKKSITVSVYATIPVAGLTLGTTTEEITLDDIPRQANIASAPSFNDEENPTITYTNAAGKSVTSLDACISLTGSADDIAYREISKTESSYTFNLTEAERNVLRNACTTANSRTVIFFVRTVIAGITYYSTLSRTLSIVNANPVISNAEAEDTNDTAIAVTGNNQTIIRGFNDVYASMAATALKGAAVKSYKIKNGNTTIEQASGSFVNAESSVFVFSVTDSRGNTTEQSIELALIEYIKLTCDLNSEAPDAEGNLSFDITGNCFAGAFGDIENEVQVLFRYKEDGGAYTGWTEIETRLGMDNRYSARVELSGLNYQSSYTFQAYAYDLLDEVTTGEETRTTIPIFDWSKKDFNFNVDAKFQKDILAKDEDGNEYSLPEKVTELNSKLAHYLYPTVLYESNSGTTDSFVLNDNSNNYEYIEVYYMHGDTYGSGCTKIYLPYINTANMILLVDDNVNSQIMSASVRFNEINAEVINNRLTDIKSHQTYDNPYISIYKVIGYKKLDM